MRLYFRPCATATVKKLDYSFQYRPSPGRSGGSGFHRILGKTGKSTQARILTRVKSSQCTSEDIISPSRRLKAFFSTSESQFLLAPSEPPALFRERPKSTYAPRLVGSSRSDAIIFFVINNVHFRREGSIHAWKPYRLAVPDPEPIVEPPARFGTRILIYVCTYSACTVRVSRARQKNGPPKIESATKPTPASN